MGTAYPSARVKANRGVSVAHGGCSLIPLPPAWARVALAACLCPLCHRWAVGMGATVLYRPASAAMGRKPLSVRPGAWGLAPTCGSYYAYARVYVCALMLLAWSKHKRTTHLENFFLVLFLCLHGRGLLMLPVIASSLRLSAWEKVNGGKFSRVEYKDTKGVPLPSGCCLSIRSHQGQQGRGCSCRHVSALPSLRLSAWEKVCQGKFSLPSLRLSAWVLH